MEKKHWTDYVGDVIRFFGILFKGTFFTVMIINVALQIATYFIDPQLFYKTFMDVWCNNSTNPLDIYLSEWPLIHLYVRYTLQIPLSFFTQGVAVYFTVIYFCALCYYTYRIFEFVFKILFYILCYLLKRLADWLD